MKIQTFIISLAALSVSLPACIEKVPDTQAEKFKEIEISINTSGQPQMRSNLSDQEFPEESSIDDLDLLVFSANDEYLYRREAMKLSSETNMYRATLVETTEQLTIHLFANCRSLIYKWENSGDKKNMQWEEVHEQLIDNEPSRLVKLNQTPPLPMWGMVTCELDEKRAPTRLEPVRMLRSIASIDLYVEQNDYTKNFELTGLLLYYAPDKGYIGTFHEQGIDSKPYKIPPDMTTTLNGELYAANVESRTINDKQYKGIARQMYLYDNYAVSRADENHRPTRVIMMGEYTPPGGTPVNAFYPIDLVTANGEYRPVTRNWKYELKVSAVNGPGQSSKEDAAKAAQSDLDLEIIEWNREDVEIGVRGKYYVSIDRRAAMLWRNAGSTDRINLTYKIEDGVEADFKINFRADSKNGDQQTGNDHIYNESFKVTMSKPSSGKEGKEGKEGTVVLDVEALREYASGHDKDYVEITYRELHLGFSITQLGSSENDWINGGSIPARF